MPNRKTCTVGDLHLIRAGVALLDVHPAHVIGEVVGGACVEEPRLARVGLVGGRIASTVVLGLECLVETIFALKSLIPPVLADLTAGAIALAVVAPAIVVALAASVLATTTAPLVGAVATGGCCCWPLLY